MKKLLIFIVMIVVIPALIYCWRIRDEFYNETVFEGYVVDGKTSGSQTALTFEMIPVKTLYEKTLEYPPASGAAVSVKNQSVKTGADGYFKLKYHYWFFEDKKITLSVDGTEKPIDIPLAIGETEPFFMAVQRFPNGGAVYTRKSGPDLKKTPVLMTAVDLFDLWEPDESRWKPVLDLLAGEGLTERFLFFESEISSLKDYRDCLDGLDRRISVIHKITGKPVVSIGYSLGALALRYFTLSRHYETGEVASILQIAPPNHGLTFPDFIVKQFSGEKEKLYSQIRSGSRFFQLINGDLDITEEYAAYYRLNPEYIDEKGFNPKADVEIIAGEVVKEKKEKLEEVIETVSSPIDVALKFWVGVGEKLGITESGDGAEEKSDKGWAKIETIKNLKPGDMIVSLESALVEGIPHTVLPYDHFDLMKPEGLNDQRYQLVKTYLIKHAR